MKIYEIINRCKDIIFGADSCEDVAAQSDETGAAENRSVDTLLLACCNLTLEELYCDYATSIRKTVVKVENGFTKLDGLRLNRVISLKDGDGADVRYRYSDDGLQAADGTYNLTYARLPEQVEAADELLLPSPRITPRIFVYGVLKEYYFAVNDSVFADIWEERYKDALKIANVKQSRMQMPQRRWLG